MPFDHAFHNALRAFLFLFIIINVSSMISWDSAHAARRAIKKRAQTPSPWFGSTDVTYSNWFKDKLEGGGETRIGSLQLGLNLPYNFSTFIRVSAMPDPDGFQDVHAGLSKSFIVHPSLRHTLSSSFSLPTSEYSRSIQQKTQASIAATQEYFLSSATLTFTGYGARAFYRDDGAITPEASLWLKRENRGQAKKNRPRSATPLTTDGLAVDEFGTAAGLEFDYSDVIYQTRFDRLWGGALDFTWRFNSSWAVSSAGSLTQSIFTTDESVWTADVTLMQATYSHRSLSLFAATGFLDSSPAILWPKARTVTIGTSYLFLN
ncbi:hypothetical protein [Oligoflexus tunisiensis]|uniref:hypothetical protein n=1 Tax=Oligoflexus tunisiensis TaxID=708132 RepID=UPI00114CFD2A|nr:hypothetical protein [Oligoflexus tunisiensis]